MASTINASTSGGLVTTADTSGVLQLQTANTTAVTIDASQNVGIGVTPSAWSGIKSIQVGTNSSFSGFSGGNYTYVGTNWYYNGTDRYISNSGATVYVQDSGSSAHKWFIAPSGTAGNAANFTQAMTLDASGNLGLGITPSAWLGTFKAMDFASSSGGAVASTGGSISVSHNVYYNGTNWIYKANGFGSRYEQLAGGAGTSSHAWYIAPSGTAGNTITWTQAMTLDASGNLFVGSTSLPTTTGFGVSQYSGGTYTRIAHNTSASSTDGYVQFFYNNTQIGQIQQNGTSAVSYSTSSDYRLKENVQPMTGALAKVVAMKPCTYKWKSDGADGEGFIAHELAEVCPQAVTGEKDAVDKDGKPIYQGIDTSFLVATLTAAIQELKAELDQAKAEIATLKGA